MLRRVLLAMSVVMLWSCADDKAKTEEPVAATDDAAKLPDSPGDGETATKAAGDGQAGSTAAPAGKDQAKAAAPAGATETFVVASGALNVRSGAGMSHAVVRTVQKGETVTGSCNRGWCQLGPSEFAARKFLEPKK